MPRPRISIAVLLAAVFAVSSIPAPLPTTAASGTVRMILTFDPGTTGAEADAAARASGGTVVGSIPQLNVRVVEVPAMEAATAQSRLARDSQVAGMELDGTVTVDWQPSEPLWGYQWEHRQIRAPKAWDITRGAGTTLVAVVDTGVRFDHPDLAGRLRTGYDFVNNDDHPRDDNGHGTMVAGVIAALASNKTGIAGACNRCKILPVKALNSSGNGYWSDAAAGIAWAADRGADVINLSFGGPNGGTTLYNAIAYARSKGSLVIASAGNNGSTALFYPGSYHNVVGVAASNDMDLPYSWSNRSKSWVEMTAPGCTWTTKKPDAYGSFCGTSASTPVVAAVAALVESIRPALDDDDIEQILKDSTVRTPYAYTRFGRIDAYTAVHRAAHGVPPTNVRYRPRAPLYPSGTRLTFLAGIHRGYRFEASGAILGAKSMTLTATSSAITRKLQTIPGRSGSWFYVANGGLGGFWVQDTSTVYLTPEGEPPLPPTEPAPELVPVTPPLDPTLRVSFTAGKHTGYRFNTNGDIIGKRPLTLSADSGASTSKVAWLPSRTGSWFYIVDGGLAGYWVKASSRRELETGALPTASRTKRLLPTDPTFTPRQRVRFAAGGHAGHRFATNGDLLHRRTIHLGRGTGAPASKRMQVPGRSGWWLFIVKGELAGYWVQESSRVHLKP